MTVSRSLAMLIKQEREEGGRGGEKSDDNTAKGQPNEQGGTRAAVLGACRMSATNRDHWIVQCDMRASPPAPEGGGGKATRKKIYAYKHIQANVSSSYLSVCLSVCLSVSFSLSLSLSHTHTHTRIHKERQTEQQSQDFLSLPLPLPLLAFPSNTHPTAQRRGASAALFSATAASSTKPCPSCPQLSHSLLDATSQACLAWFVRGFCPTDRFSAAFFFLSFPFGSWNTLCNCSRGPRPCAALHCTAHKYLYTLNSPSAVATAVLT